jgi:hypothetical protein
LPPAPFGVLIGVTLSTFVLMSAMGVLISLVAIPLRENVPIFSLNLVLQIFEIRLEYSPRPDRLGALVKRLQVIEIPNT